MKKKNKNNLAEIKNMWLFAMFDLPTVDKEEKREYTHFRKILIENGFTMLQFSVYARFCSSRENAETYIGHIKNVLPEEGQVRIMMVTDKQFGDMYNYAGTKRIEPESQPEQLLLF